MKYVINLLLAFSLFSCQSENSFESQFQMEQLQKALESKTKELDAILAEDDVKLQHIVFFDLKDSIDEDEKEEFIGTIRKLRKIDEVKSFNYGSFENLEDERALDRFEIIMDLGFESKEDYKVYQAHKTHIEVKKALGPYFGGPPATYDYVIK